jgi:hypothetical protein
MRAEKTAFMPGVTFGFVCEDEGLPENMGLRSAVKR